MIKRLFSPNPLWTNNGLAAVRVIIGLLMAYHGLEIFNRKAMEAYLAWDVIKGLPAPEMIVYLGKGIEFFSGLCFVVGLFTRIAAALMAVDMLLICFKIGNGKFFYEDQHPFLFALIGGIFFFTGPGDWGLDFIFFKKPK